MSNRDKQEYICCAAIYVDDGVAHGRTYAYPKTGYIFCGLGHVDCMPAFRAWADGLSADETYRLGHDLDQGTSSGFLTSKGRYVNRFEGREIALAAGQITDDATFNALQLFSEDLY